MNSNIIEGLISRYNHLFILFKVLDNVTLMTKATLLQGEHMSSLCNMFKDSTKICLLCEGNLNPNLRTYLGKSGHAICTPCVRRYVLVNPRCVFEHKGVEKDTKELDLFGDLQLDLEEEYVCNTNEYLEILTEYCQLRFTE
mgnify:FL=1